MSSTTIIPPMVAPTPIPALASVERELFGTRDVEMDLVVEVNSVLDIDSIEVGRRPGVLCVEE